MELELIDGSLYVLDTENDEVIYEFERGTLSRAAYKHMCAWVITNFSIKFKGDSEDLWRQAGEAWESLSPPNQTAIWSLMNYERQSAMDISQGLLATLHGYQGSAAVKREFSKAIQRVRNIFE